MGTTLAAGGSLRSTWLGPAYLLAGNTRDALTATRRALEIARSRKERGNEAHARWLLGQVAELIPRTRAH